MGERGDITVTGVGCPGIYTLDCYCDVRSGNHAFNEFPHQYTDEFGSRCRAVARKSGWLLDFRKNRFLCPKCNPKSRKFIAPATTLASQEDGKDGR